MLRKRIDEVALLEPGINPSKYENQITNEISFYDQPSFAADYEYKSGYYAIKHKTHMENFKATVKEGDVVISSGASLATIVSKANAGKVLTNNFIKVELNTQLLDKRYFIYMFNVNNTIQRQKAKGMQGTTFIQRITLKSLGEMMMPIVSLAEQEKIGRIHSESRKLQSQLNTYAGLIDLFTCAVLEETTREE